MSEAYAKLTVEKLKEECGKRGLKKTGKKSDLIQLLVDNDNQGGNTGESESVPEKEKQAPKTRGKKAAKKEEVEEEAEAEEEEEEVQTKKKTKVEPKAATKGTHSAKPDPNLRNVGSKSSGVNRSDFNVVYSDGNDTYDVMLNQTNVGQNNNKFYVIQLLSNPSGEYLVYTRWGRVGDVGQSAAEIYGDVDGAIKGFNKKFKEKTKNDFNSRANFVKHNGKYDLIEKSYSDDEEEPEEEHKGAEKPKKKSNEKSSLSPDLQEFLTMITSNDMFKQQLEHFDIDVKKMPLGKISKTQIQKGFDVLVELDEELKKDKPSSKTLESLSSKFYTIIPHNVGRQNMAKFIIREHETVQQKMDMLNVMGDIEVAQNMLNSGEESSEHPLDASYKQLKNKLTLVPKTDEIYKIIEKYIQNTKQSYAKCPIVRVFEVEREGELERSAKFKNLDNRKLLWHGTNVAVVCAILKTGIRLMPHSGGRVGRGLYFASEHAKSYGYTRGDSRKHAVMFLNEIALGKEHHITKDDSSLVRAPPGFDSIIAKGRMEPNPKDDITLAIGSFGHKLTIPQGKAIDMAQHRDSSFFNSEYLVYDEGQVRIRYLVELIQE